MGYGVFPPRKAKLEWEILHISPPRISVWVKVFHWDLKSLSPGTQPGKLLQGSITRAVTATLPFTPQISFALNPGSGRDFHLQVSHQEAFPSTGCCGKAAGRGWGCRGGGSLSGGGSCRQEIRLPQRSGALSRGSGFPQHPRRVLLCRKPWMKVILSGSGCSSTDSPSLLPWLEECRVCVNSFWMD